MDSNTQPTADAEATKTPPPADQVATVKISDGREITIHKFQAREFVQAVNQATRDKATDGMSISAYLLARICTIASKSITFDDILDLPQYDTTLLMEHLKSDVQIDRGRIGKQYIFGHLPSGREFSLRYPKTRDTINAGKIHGEENRQFALVALCCEIDGKPIDIHDVKLMDGIDFMALSGELNGVPT